MIIDPQSPMFTDETAARETLEAERWPNGPICPHCGNSDPERIAQVRGKKRSHRPGLYYCNECKGQFTVTVGTVFERSKIPLNKWLLATFLLSSSKKGMSAHQLHRMLGVTYKTAWFMAHRIREAMADPKPEPMGGAGKVVEADETYFGPKDHQPKTRTDGTPFNSRGKRGPEGKRTIISLVERGGSVRSFHVERATKDSVREILVRNASRESTLHTDESNLYVETGAEFAGHHTTKHSAGEYVRYTAAGVVHSNTIEGYFSIFKRGMKGVYQHCGEAHLHRYLAEFDFRYNTRAALGVNDAARTAKALMGIGGKRLTYRRPDAATVA
jgi:transposase-like protein